ncbi:MAG: RNA-binding cell elongation regulator Jag/EloR [Acidimicrobiia bacterium]
MEWVETTGRSLEEAKARALDLLEVHEADVEFVVVSEPQFGWFGRLKTKARVRARVRPVRPRPKIERRDRKRKGAGRGETSSGNRAESAGDEVDSAPRPERKKKRTPKAAPAGNADSVDSPAVDVADDVRPEDEAPTTNESDATKTDADAAQSVGDPSSKNRKSGRGRRPKAAASSDGDDDTEISDDDDGSYTMDPEAMQAEAERAKQFLTGLAGAFGSTALATARIDDENIECALDGDDLGLLIGPRGQTLQSIQELTRSVAQRGGRAAARMHVDIAGYRHKRAAALSRFAIQIADDVASTGTPRALEPMSAADRKVIHDAVTGVSGVESVSQGEDPHRYVLIRPV